MTALQRRFLGAVLMSLGACNPLEPALPDAGGGTEASSGADVSAESAAGAGGADAGSDASSGAESGGGTGGCDASLGAESGTGEKDGAAGLDATADSSSPVVVRQIAVGAEHTCALLTNGAVRCWGRGDSGRLGYGNTNTIGDDEIPASAGDVNVGGTVQQIAAGSDHTCALLTTGAVRCWGHGGDGRLGYGNTNTIGDNETPASAGDVNVGGTVQQIAAGGGHTCALLTNGAVRCWGEGSFGQLGYGNTNWIGDNETPASAGDVPVGGTVQQIAAGIFHTCAVLTNGAVRCWGYGACGPLG
jgi:alpha-tubulin suppressor-like RCC1 family protein